MIKILSICQSDISGGAARAAYRLARKLVHMDVNIKMQVMRKLSNEAWILGPSNIFQQFISKLLPRLDQFVKRIVGVKQHCSWSMNLFPNPLLNKVKINSFNVIHINWVGKNMIPIDWIRNFNRPVVWTLHDSWAFTGGCHLTSGCRRFEQECGYCPQLVISSRDDISNKIWHKKSIGYHSVSFHFVAPSNWIAEEAKASSLLKGFPVTVIPNGLDTNVYMPKEKSESRSILSLPTDKRIILFGAMYADTDRNKGMDLLIEALHILGNQDENFSKQNLLVVFGTDNDSLSKLFPLPMVCLGMINDEKKLAYVYSAADLTVVSSRSESFGQVASESLSCGTPVVAFNTTGLKDIIDHLETGYLAKDFQTSDLAQGIKLLVERLDICKKMSLNARQQAVMRFDINVVAGKYYDLFEKLVVD